MSNQEEIGIVTFFHVRRGFGKIRTDKHPTGVFAHFSEVQGAAQILIPHELVSIRVVESPKGPVAKRIRRLSPRLSGTIVKCQRNKQIIRSDAGKEFHFIPQDILSDNRNFHRILAGWQVQFSPYEEDHTPLAKEIVICDTRTPFQQLVKCDPWAQRLHTLAGIAQEESWGEADQPYSVLENYLSEAFRILLREGGIHSVKHATSRQGVAIWNTGLLSKNGEEILARMDDIQIPRQENGYLSAARWKLSGFYPQSDRRIPPLKKQLPIAIEYLPHDKLVPNPSAHLVPDLDHLLRRNQRLPGYWSGLPREEQIQRLRGALHKLGQLLRRNPRIAIPQWYEETVQYLVPLDVGDGNGPIGALVLEEQDHQLRVQTILQLDWAYQNARLLGPVQDNWLAHWKARQETKRGPRIYWTKG